MSLKFKPEDFECVVPKIGQTDESALACEAQRIFDEWLAKQPVVYLQEPSYPKYFNFWLYEKIGPATTHQARLCCIEEIKKCEHPKKKVKQQWTQTMIDIKEPEEIYYCECGAKVQPKEFEEVT